MTERALTPASSGADGAGPDAGRLESPAIRLLDALREGDDQALLAAVSQSTTVVAENLPMACRGPDEVETMLRVAREHFPGLTYESSTRHVGFGLVIEEARVRDAGFDAGSDPGSGAGPSDGAAVPDETPTEAPVESRTALVPYGAEPEPDLTHPMWDDPGAGGHAAALALWREQGLVDMTPVPLNLPVRVTVRHDDLQVHEVRLSFPAALLRRALGQYVDPLEMSLGEVQSAFIAPVGVGLTTHHLTTHRPAEPQPVPTETPAGASEAVGATSRPRRRRRRLRIAVILAVLAVLAGAGWWFVQTRDSAGPAAPVPSSVTPSTLPSAAPPSQAPAPPSSSKAPTVTRTQSTAAPTRAPNVTLRSDLAFGFNSATLSPAAKSAIARVAHDVRRAGLSGKIYVDGYTDDIGSSAYGLVLSQRRADAVSGYLQSQLLGAPVAIVSVGHGESHPVADNTTAAGRQQNRRVTITLPKP